MLGFYNLSFERYPKKDRYGQRQSGSPQCCENLLNNKGSYHYKYCIIQKLKMFIISSTSCQAVSTLIILLLLCMTTDKTMNHYKL